MKRRDCSERLCEDGSIPSSWEPCRECQPEEAENHFEETVLKTQNEAIARELSNWYLRALATVAGYQHYGMEVPKLNYQVLIFGTFSGDHDGMIKYLKKIVADGQTAFEKAGKS